MSKSRKAKTASSMTANDEMGQVAEASSNGKVRAARNVEYIVVGQPINGGPPECIQSKPTIGQVKKYYSENKAFLSRYFSSVRVIKGREVPAEVLNA